MPLDILLPNGQVLAVQVYIDAGAGPTKWDGVITAGSITVTGPLTDTQLRASAVPISAATLPLPSGAATENTLALVVTQSSFASLLGALTETAPVTDTASSGVSGRLQRIAQRITSLIAAIGSPFQAGGAISNSTFASTVADGANVVEGTTTGAKVITDATGTLQQYLRGLIYLSLRAGRPATAYSHLNHNPATNTKATITKSSGGGTVRNVCTSFAISISAGSTAPAAIQLTVALIDGSTGGTTYLWGPTTISLPATAGATAGFVMSNCFKPGSQATAMTLEFSAAGGANTFETVEFDCIQIAD